MRTTDWNLKDIYATDKDFRNDWKIAEEGIGKIEKFKGKINTEEALLNFLLLKNDLHTILDKIEVYTSLRWQENIKDDNIAEDYNKMQELKYHLYNDAESFFSEELLSNSNDFLDNLYVKEPKLEIFKSRLSDIIRQKSHILSPEKVQSIKEYESTIECYISEYITLTEEKMDFSKCDTRRDDLNLYNQFKDTISEIFLGEVKARTAISKIRQYGSYMEQRLNEMNSSVNLFNNVIENVNNNEYLYKKYLLIRKEALGLDNMNIEDEWSSIIKGDNEKEYSYEEGKSIVLKALQPIGKEYISILEKGFNSNWASVYPKENKRDKVFSWGAYDTPHPYVFLNFDGTYRSVSDIAHEFGHAIHQYYCTKNQPFHYYEFPYILDETVAITNEILLAESILKEENDVYRRITLLDNIISHINNTIIMQTRFAEFEKWVYEKTYEGTELTGNEINNYFNGILKRSYDSILEYEPSEVCVWARIWQLFEEPFYVYQYPTGMIAAICVANRLLNDKDDFSKKYMEVLKLGESVKPFEQLKMLDIDLETDKPYKEAFQYYEEKINELQYLVKKIK